MSQAMWKMEMVLIYSERLGRYVYSLAKKPSCVSFFLDELASITTSSFIFAVNWRKGGKLLSWISFNCLWADLSLKHAKCKYVNAIWHAIAFLKVSKHDFYCNYSEKNVHRSFFSFTSTIIMVKQLNLNHGKSILLNQRPHIPPYIISSFVY